MTYLAIGDERRNRFRPYSDKFVTTLARRIARTHRRHRQQITRRLRWSFLSEQQREMILSAMTSKFRNKLRSKKQKRERRPRPPIPLWVRIFVAVRQISAKGIPLPDNRGLTRKQHLELLLKLLFGEAWTRAECDHRPPLGMRDYNQRVKVLADRYTPNANDPNFLEYILDDEHLDRSAGRGGDKMRFGGDVREMTKGRSLRARPDLWRVREHGKPALKTTRKRKPKRKFSWPKGRKIQSRGFDRRS